MSKDQKPTVELLDDDLYEDFPATVASTEVLETLPSWTDTWEDGILLRPLLMLDDNVSDFSKQLEQLKK
ncbi:hypothetical protein HDV03_001387 [Kappamyces sp. JEL0829]|nr:hypothetical protein HDV03_001387 [Kappamyces sp. JEL0829]